MEDGHIGDAAESANGKRRATPSPAEPSGHHRPATARGTRTSTGPGTGPRLTGRPPTRPRIGPIVEATVVVRDLDAAVARYRDGFGWTVTTAHHRDAATFGDPAAARTALVGPRPPAGAPGMVRLVEHPGIARPEPLRRYGWTAIELCVLDVAAAMARAVDCGWTLLRAPDPLAGGRLPLVAGQIAGPDGEAVYLTQQLGEVPGFDLPRPRRDVDGVFIAVLGARDLEATRHALERRYPVRRASDRRSPIGVLNVAYDLPEGTAHRISTLQLDGRSCIEIDQLPPGTLNRAGPVDVPTGGVASGGVASVAVAVRSGVPAAVVELPDGARLELRPDSITEGS